MESPSVVQTADGPTVVYRNRNLYNPRTPVISAVRRAQAVTIPPRSLVLVPSPLLGHGISELLENCTPDSRIVLMELEDSLDALSRRALPQLLLDDERVIYCSPRGSAEIEACLPQTLRNRFERVLLVRLNAGFSLHADSYQRILIWIQDEIRRSWQNRMTTLHMGRLWFRNLFDNLALLPYSVPIRHLSTNKPVVVLGAGPSLEMLLPELVRMREQFLIVAVDTALPVLSSVNITADLVIAVEAQHANLSDFLGVDPGQSLLVADLFSFPGAIRRFPPERRLFFCSRPVDSAFLSHLEREKVLPLPIPPLGSVGVVAIYLAITLFDTPVAFCGLDFAYPDGKTHARGAPWLERELRTTNRLSGDRIFPACLARPRIIQPDKNGLVCKTDVVLLSYAEQLRSLVAGRPDLVDLGSTGLPTGARRSETLAEFVSLSGGDAADRRVPNGYANQPERVQTSDDSLPPVSAQRMRCLLENELERVYGVQEAILERLTGADIPSDKDIPCETRDPQPESLDYLLLGTPYRSLSNEATQRAVLAAARFFSMRMNRSIETLCDRGRDPVR